MVESRDADSFICADAVYFRFSSKRRARAYHFESSETHSLAMGHICGGPLLLVHAVMSRLFRTLRRCFWSRLARDQSGAELPASCRRTGTVPDVPSE
eukprot:scaffold447452_cov23-Prasinocladus_malaysianus.AAC.1